MHRLEQPHQTVLTFCLSIPTHYLLYRIGRMRQEKTTLLVLRSCLTIRYHTSHSSLNSYQFRYPKGIQFLYLHVQRIPTQPRLVNEITGLFDPITNLHTLWHRYKLNKPPENHFLDQSLGYASLELLPILVHHLSNTHSRDLFLLLFCVNLFVFPVSWLFLLYIFVRSIP